MEQTLGPLIFPSLATRQIQSPSLSPITYRSHLYHLHHHRFYLLLLVQSFILNLRLGSSANPFLHRSFLFYRTDSMHSRTISCFYSAQRLDLFAWCVRPSRHLVGFRTHFYFITLHYITLH